MEKIKQWCYLQFIKLLIKLKFLRQIRYTEKELNQLLINHLPQHYPLKVPGGRGDFIILNAIIDLPKNDKNVQITVESSIDLFYLEQHVYRAILEIKATAVPFFSKGEYKIQFQTSRIHSIKLLSDNYFVFSTGQEWLRALAPKPLKNWLTLTIETAKTVFSTLGQNEFQQYLLQLTNGSKQQIINLHQKDIEHFVQTLIESDELCYQLEPTDFEENLFANFGKKITVEEQCLIFHFHE